MDVVVRPLYAGGANRSCELVGYEVFDADGEVLGFGLDEAEARNAAQTEVWRRELQEHEA